MSRHLKAFLGHPSNDKLKRIDRELHTCRRTMAQVIHSSTMTRGEPRVSIKPCQGYEVRDLVTSHLTSIFPTTIHRITNKCRIRARYANSNNSERGASISVQCFIPCGVPSSGRSLSEAPLRVLDRSSKILIADNPFLMTIVY